MALVIFNDGRRPKTITSHEKANHIWQVLNGEAAAENEAQEAFVLAIERIYLNRTYAPDSYLQMYPEVAVADSYASVLGVRR